MKQLLILMAFLLAMMLLLFVVMAVGNAKQSVQIADRVQQLSNLKAELRSVQKENRTLSGELEAVQAQNRKLRWEQQAVAQQLSGLLPDPAGGLPVLPQTAGGQPAGELLLEAMAVRRLAAVGTAESTLENEATPLPTEAATAGGRICWAADGSDAQPSGGGEAADAQPSGVAAKNAAVAAVTAGIVGGGAEQQKTPCCRSRAGCCHPGSDAAKGDTVLAISETITVPAVSSSTAAAAMLPLLCRQAEEMDSLLHSLFGLVHALTENIAAIPLEAGI